jgi:hypothetical protein
MKHLIQASIAVAAATLCLSAASGTSDLHCQPQQRW